MYSIKYDEYFVPLLLRAQSASYLVRNKTMNRLVIALNIVVMKPLTVLLQRSQSRNETVYGFTNALDRS